MQEQNKLQYKKLGLNIAYYRKAKGLSQSDLAEKINISRTHMSRIETADCAVSLDVIFDICRVFQISEKELFDFRL
ncbi:MAG: helix-turn-helix transcriptional regulator [Clostridia bacterium]|nr:helix-turn-helix transcriptional regulator [Clostridia bacterium]MBR3953853.1 helix-turn-helix transcriptional regulator [Clostridia bacterium]